MDRGSIALDGQALEVMSERQLANWRRLQIGLVFQQFNLIGSLRVADNLAFQARLAGRLDQGWLAQLVERLGLGDLLQRYPEQLSGGQQQRVALGRALASRSERPAGSRACGLRQSPSPSASSCIVPKALASAVFQGSRPRKPANT